MQLVTTEYNFGYVICHNITLVICYFREMLLILLHLIHHHRRIPDDFISSSVDCTLPLDAV